MIDQMDIVERLKFDAARCEAIYSKGIATNIEAAIAEIEQLRSEFAAILHVLVGNTGLSAILEAKKLREMHPLDADG